MLYGPEKIKHFSHGVNTRRTMEKLGLSGNSGRKCAPSSHFTSVRLAIEYTSHGVVYVWHLITWIFTHSLSIYFDIGDVLRGPAVILVQAALPHHGRSFSHQPQFICSTFSAWNASSPRQCNGRRLTQVKNDDILKNTFLCTWFPLWCLFS